jgi:hypothetical protein
MVKAFKMGGIFIKDGDTLAIVGKKNSRGVFQAGKVYNHSTESEIQLKGRLGETIGTYLTVLSFFAALGILIGVYLIMFAYHYSDKNLGFLLFIGSLIILIVTGIYRWARG